ncbi:MAG: FKBP-type peptidyl-prolyl cis-trans isomerase [Mediterranea sp.]|jgi:FKBP-type peptidyl-prolyl cis-trans isomerase FklB|nr:FKBP-type peptidyl-prolyl cis-trans isomerase [Mediterranea sp.]
MKKVRILMVAVAAAGLVSCTAQSPKPTLKTDIDSLSYATGLAQTDGLTMYLVHQAGVDTTYMSEFIKGFNEGARMTGTKDVAYLEGLKIGQMVAKNWVQGMNQQIFNGDSTKTITKSDLLAGFVAGVKKDTTKMTMQFAQAYRQSATERIQEKIIFEKYSDNREAGEKFLAENKTKEGVKTTESGLQYKVITEGKGEIPTAESKVKVNYKGTLIDSTEFDSSYKRNEPSIFRADQVIKGWTEALTMMPVGSKWELYIPQELAYGSKEQGQQIKPFSALIFEVELVGIEKDK